MMRIILPAHEGHFADEIAFYLQHSFGDVQRLDYGSGHEANFACWMYHTAVIIQQ